MAQRAIPVSEPPDQHDHIVVLNNATWADLQRHLEMRQGKAVPRIVYLKGRLELMSPSRTHEAQKSNIGRLVEAWCRHQRIEFSPYGAWTLEDKEVERAVEPDECYVFGDDPEPERPDLAIEVIWTSGSIDKLEVYRLLGVREVWIYQRGTLTLHALRGERYVAIDQSEVLRGIDHATLST